VLPTWHPGRVAQQVVPLQAQGGAAVQPHQGGVVGARPQQGAQHPLLRQHRPPERPQLLAQGLEVVLAPAGPLVLVVVVSRAAGYHRQHATDLLRPLGAPPLLGAPQTLQQVVDERRLQGGVTAAHRRALEPGRVEGGRWRWR